MPVLGPTKAQIIFERLQGVAIILGGFAILIDKLLPLSVFWFTLFVCIGMVMMVASFINLKIRKTKIYYYVTSGLFIAGVIVFFKLQNNKEKAYDVSMDKFETKLQSLRWVAYEPINFDPYTKSYANTTEISAELDTLFKHECTGIITFNSDSTNHEIPKIVRELKGDSVGVIMGIINLSDPMEIDAAIAAAPYVDAYCVGHMFTDYPFSVKRVLEVLRLIKTKTEKPVTTTLRPSGYKTFPEIIKNIDWFFPDIHAKWYTNPDCKSIFEETREYIKELRSLQRLPGKANSTQNDFIPSGDLPGATPKEQYNFFRLITEFTESSIEFPERIYTSYFSAFDIKWKTHERYWPLGERTLGFFDEKRNPKVAVLINNDTVRVIDALNWSNVKRPY